MRCVDAFVANGFVDEQSVVDQCEYINNDDLSLKEAKVPFKLVAMTYQTISDFRKKAPSEVCSIAKYTLSITRTFLYILYVCIYLCMYVCMYVCMRSFLSHRQKQQQQQPRRVILPPSR